MFCTKLDQTLLSTYNKDEIRDILKNQGWNVNEVIITKSKKSFRIVMTDRNQAQKYINSTDTAIGGIKLTEENKEPEIDPTIKQCEDCGQLEPDQNSYNCMGRKICLKCKTDDFKGPNGIRVLSNIQGQILPGTI